ncbi:peroxiredoxin family protein [Rubrobacter taiwanensis]|uniref:peroxiredoxin family protein n=1 Tax=Rubrobacter taiwanensis TaxID=185139 RepID=UPI0014053D0F|nr:redoxin domain-containing protein [Rubrobacter taiwanensis]
MPRSLIRTVRRVLLVVLLVAVASVAYRTLGSPELGTGGTLTLPGPAPNVGQAAQTFVVNRHDGGIFRLSDEGVYVLTFWSSLNQNSMEARPAFAALAREYEGRGVRFAAVYVSNVPASEEDAPYAVLQDRTGNLTSYYNVKQIPRLFVISDGRIALVQNDYYPENVEVIRETLERELTSGTGAD